MGEEEVIEAREDRGEEARLLLLFHLHLPSAFSYLHVLRHGEPLVSTTPRPPHACVEPSRLYTPVGTRDPGKPNQKDQGKSGRSAPIRAPHFREREAYEAALIGGGKLVCATTLRFLHHLACKAPKRLTDDCWQRDTESYDLSHPPPRPAPGLCRGAALTRSSILRRSLYYRKPKISSGMIRRE